MKKILVTGGLGYIGSHTVVSLIENNYEVEIVDNLSNSNIWILDRIEQITNIRPVFHNIDVNDELNLTKIFEKNSFDGIIHFAAFKAVGESVNKPLEYYYNNISGLLSLLRVQTRFKTQNLVFSSSCTVYGEPNRLPVDESFPTQKAESPYGNTKKIGEEILKDVSHANNLNVISLRYFNPVGAHKSSLLGELPIGKPNNLMPMLTQTAAGIREKIVVFGNDYNTHDGTCLRDYIHVVDLADAHVAAINRLIGGEIKSNYEVFNVGTGNGISVLELIQTFEKVNGLKLNYEIGNRREGDVEKIYANCDLANNELKWVAKKNIEDMVKSAWEWQKSLGNT